MIKKIKLSQLLITSYEDAVGIKDKINNGESFEAVQEAYGLPGSHEIGLYSVGDVDPIPETVCTLSDNIQIAVMGLAVNEISEPIEIEIYGSHSWVIMKRLP